jgi:transketolase
MCGLTFLEPADAVDLENCLNWAVNHPGPVYMRLHDGVVKSFAVSDAERSLIAYTAYDPCSQPKVIVVASGLPVGEAVKLAVSKDKEGTGIRVVNVVNPKDLGAEFVGEMIEGIPVLTVYNGNPNILQSAVAKAVMENSGSRPSVISGHGYCLGTSGKLEDLLRHFRLDAEGIEREIQLRFPVIN